MLQTIKNSWKAFKERRQLIAEFNAMCDQREAVSDGVDVIPVEGEETINNAANTFSFIALFMVMGLFIGGLVATNIAIQEMFFNHVVPTILNNK